ncbi:hypothetical protein PTKIN_Ptkin13bG0209800 [Pterospermum kingtungense]
MEKNLQGLTISTGEEDEFILGPDEEVHDDKQFDFYLVGRFLTDRSINFNVMRNRLAAIWRPRKGTCVKDIGEGFYLVQFFHIVDMKRIQIYNLPVGGKQLGDFIGKFIDYDVNNNTGMWRTYMRIRLMVDVRVPLKRCSPYHNLRGQSHQFAAYQQGQQHPELHGALGYPGIYNSQAGISIEQQQQNRLDMLLNGSQDPSTKHLP